MVLIYTQKITPRITYAFHQVLGRILGLELKFTSKIEEFIASDGVKLSYGKQKMGNEFFVKAHGLLNGQGVSEPEVIVRKWHETPCFFRAGEGSDIPFDIFSAAFYMLSRYEEYLPHVKDANGRYPVKESLAFRKKFLELPVVDLWAYKLKRILKKRFPEKRFAHRKSSKKNILAVAEVYKYRKKGLMRHVGGGIRDLSQMQMKAVFERVQTLLYLQKDPYDIYDALLKFSKQHGIEWEFMFQLSDYSIKNKNVGYNKEGYHTLIKSMGDYGRIGLLLGYDALFDFATLKKEKKRWEGVVNRDLDRALSSTYGLNLPQLYNNYDTLEIGEDYSMSFAEQIGFRAGTCTSFLYYDLNLERISPLEIHPVACNSASFKNYTFFETKKILGRLKKAVENVDGELVMLCANSDFEEGERQKKFFQLLELIYD